MNKSLEYSTSKGTILADRGPRNMVPAHNYLSGTGKSINWRGPAYYVPSERRWVMQDQYRSLPRRTCRDAIYFESEDDWVTWRSKNDKPNPPAGISNAAFVMNQPGVPVSTLLPSQLGAMNRKWSGAGYFVPTSNTWFHDTTNPWLPKDSQQFYNEEDWLKFKYMCDRPSISRKEY